MVDFLTFGKVFNELDFSDVDKRAPIIAKKIDERTGDGGDFLGWLDFSSKMQQSEIDRIKRAAEKIRKNYDCMVLCGIGGSYLGARAVIEAVQGLFRKDEFEVIYFGHTLSADYTKEVLQYLDGKRFAINCISKSGTTTETAVAFRLLKEILIKNFGQEYLTDAIYVTTDENRGALFEESKIRGYERFVIPSDIGGRYSVITPVGLLPLAVAGIDIDEFIRGVRDGEKEYSVPNYRDNPAYLYGAHRYLLRTQKEFVSEMFCSYDLKNKMVEEWLKQLFDETEGKDGKALLCSSAIFTTDLHSMGQFIQQGTPCLFETLFMANEPSDDLVIPYCNGDPDNLNYLAGKKLSEINRTAFLATLKAHTEGHTPAIVLEFKKMDAYHMGNLIYFFFRACAFSAYLLDVNPFNQPGVEIYKTNMFKMLGKPGYKD